EVSIRRNWSGHYRDGEPVFWTPKSKHSIRKFSVPDELCLALKKWKLQCPVSKWDLIFPKPDGRPQDRKATYRPLVASVRKANEKRKIENKKLRRLTVPAYLHSFGPIIRRT